MNIILLSGGSGKRLWPLSNEVMSKQFLNVLRNDDGVMESMAQRMCRMIKEVIPESIITIATSENQIPSIRSQLGEEVDISIEPCRRDTFPAIALATAYLKDKKNVDENEVVVVCPVDPYVDYGYYEKIRTIYEEAESGNANIVLMGIKPTYPSEKYGYIIPVTESEVSQVKSFKEKPTSDVAKEYISQGGLWNGGLFAFKIGYLMKKAEEELGESSYDKLFAEYQDLKKISFDYAIVEKENNINVVRYGGEWKDLGTWNTLTETMDDVVMGGAETAYCKNTHVLNTLQIPMVAIGLENTVVVATPDGVLVSKKDMSEKVKDYVADNRPMFERRTWGEYKVLDYLKKSDGQNYLTKHLIIEAGKNISYQYHKFRTEIWTVVDGEGELIIDGDKKKVKCGDTICIKPGMCHGIKALSELHIIEVQIGIELVENDIERIDWTWE